MILFQRFLRSAAERHRHDALPEERRIALRLRRAGVYGLTTIFVFHFPVR